MRQDRRGYWLGVLLAVAVCGAATGKDTGKPASVNTVSGHEVTSLRLAIEDLRATFGGRYAGGRAYLRRLERLEGELDGEGDRGQMRQRFEDLREEAMLANPLLDFEGLILLQRKKGQPGLPNNHQCNRTLRQDGYDNRIAVLSPVDDEGNLRTVYRPEKGWFVGELDLDYDGEKLLFTMPNGVNWHLWEVGVDGEGLRQVSQKEHPDVDSFDGCYLPNGGIAFASTASYTGVPCWHGQERACSLYVMDEGGKNMRQVGFDQDLDLHPAVLSNGQVIYSKWDYTGIMHMYMRPLMVMNPDGTGQRAVYGSNCYWPNCLFYPREVPGYPNRIVAVMAGYHGSKRMGELVLLDFRKGWTGDQGVVQMIPGRDRKVEPIIKDTLTLHSWPKFLHPYPLSDRYFLVASQPARGKNWGIYLVDVFDNMTPVKVDAAYDYFEPIPLQERQRPPVIPEQVDLASDEATVYLHDVYVGPGLAGVPRGTVKALRVGSYHYGAPTMAGPDKAGCGGPWEVMRIIGTVPINADGSAIFKVPANTPLFLQPLDAEGKAVQLMRSWFTAMPGEKVSCVGCHETPRETPSFSNKLASRQKPAMLEPWYGPARGYDFEREMQPVLNKYCVSCHNEPSPDKPDLRGEEKVRGYVGRDLNRLGAARLHPEVAAYFGGRRIRYTPAYETLIHYIRRVGIEDEVEMLRPGEYHADTSELVQMLRKGHQGVRLDTEAWDRLVTWIDLNGPCHGSWRDVCPSIPGDPLRRRWELGRQYGGPATNPEEIPRMEAAPVAAVEPVKLQQREAEIDMGGVWPFDADQAAKRQREAGPVEMTIALAAGIEMKLVRIPAGVFVMGDDEGEPDEGPRFRTAIDKPFWMGRFEVTNEQYRQFDPGHRSGRYTRRYVGIHGPGISLEGEKMPAVRVSWEQATAFCEWLSGKTGRRFRLPTETEWEYGCRAGTATALYYGEVTDDFSTTANVADKALSKQTVATGGVTTSLHESRGCGVFESTLVGGDVICQAVYDDGQIVSAPAGSYGANPWGLYDMHGNAAEWTRSVYRSYPCREMDDGEASSGEGEKVVRGGSWCDRPKRCRSAFRLSYPAWQRVFNVGFRVVCEDDAAGDTVKFVTDTPNRIETSWPSRD